MNKKFLTVLIGLIFSYAGDAEIWVEKTHNDFADGREYYYRGGDTATYWNDTLRVWKLGSRIYSPSEGGLRIIGQDWDLDDNDWMEVILTPASSKAVIYWNAPTGFNTSNKTDLPTKGTMPQGVSLCDLNRDGKLEILIGERDAYWAYIYDGATYSKYDSVKVLQGNQNLAPADLNNDGEMDLITPSRYWSYIYFGPGPFYSKMPMDSLYIPNAAPDGATATTVADLNYDGYLDIIISSQAGGVYTYWGSSIGWKTQTVLNCTGNYDHSTADLDKDGYLDIFVSLHTTNSIIYYGSQSGFLTTANTPGNGSGDCSIFDINDDGNLDIAATEYYSLEGYLIWGPSYNTYLNLPCGAGTATHTVEIADFDNDGDVDILFGIRGGQSYLYWNNGGFLSTNRFVFSTSSDDALFEDLGNLWDRSKKQKYLSSVFEAQDTINEIDSVNWWGNIPQGINVELWMRSALDTTSWGQWVSLSNGGTDSSLFPSKYLQYRCAFSTDYKRTSLFSFDSIKIFYDTISAGVNIKPNEYELDIHTSNLFKGGVNFLFSIPEAGIINLTVYNLVGEKVKSVIENEKYLQGSHRELWNTRDNYGKKIPNGVYIYIFEFRGNNTIFRTTRKLVIIQ